MSEFSPEDAAALKEVFREQAEELPRGVRSSRPRARRLTETRGFAESAAEGRAHHQG